MMMSSALADGRIRSVSNRLSQDRLMRWWDVRCRHSLLVRFMTWIMSTLIKQLINQLVHDNVSSFLNSKPLYISGSWLCVVLIFDYENMCIIILYWPFAICLLLYTAHNSQDEYGVQQCDVCAHSVLYDDITLTPTPMAAPTPATAAAAPVQAVAPQEKKECNDTYCPWRSTT